MNLSAILFTDAYIGGWSYLKGSCKINRIFMTLVCLSWLCFSYCFTLCALIYILKLASSQASEKIVHVEEKLSRGWGGENAYHVSGYRYLLVDTDKRISRTSPPGKVMTLAKVSTTETVLPFICSIQVFLTHWLSHDFLQS